MGLFEAGDGMSKDLGYFPPCGGGKYRWFNKSLNYSPWRCDLGGQMNKRKLSIWPASVWLTVDLIDGQYVWRADVTGWSHEASLVSGTAPSAEAAITAAEKAGEEAFRALMPAWVVTALENGWRPPHSKPT